jgi:hypothetical protein
VTTVHRNLNLAAWTVKDTPSSPTRRVKAIALRGVTFVVQPGGRARVLARKVRATPEAPRPSPATPPA